MSHRLIPVAGQWYLHLDKGQPFCVVDVDKNEDHIGLQHFDGDIEELGFADWFEMDLGIAAEPEDAWGQMDEVESTGTGFGNTALTPEDWRASLEEAPSPEDMWDEAPHLRTRRGDLKHYSNLPQRGAVPAIDAAEVDEQVPGHDRR